MDSSSVKRLREGFNENISLLLSYINELDTLIVNLDELLDKHQPIFIGRGRVRLESNYFRFFKQKKLANTDKWIFLRIPSTDLFKRINRDCVNEVTRPIFLQLKKLVEERNKLYKMLSLFNRNMNKVKSPKSLTGASKLINDLKGL
jgi:shikimate kinase